MHFVWFTRDVRIGQKAGTSVRTLNIVRHILEGGHPGIWSEGLHQMMVTIVETQEPQVLR